MGSKGNQTKSQPYGPSVPTATSYELGYCLRVSIDGTGTVIAPPKPFTVYPFPGIMASVIAPDLLRLAPSGIILTPS